MCRGDHFDVRSAREESFDERIFASLSSMWRTCEMSVALSLHRARASSTTLFYRTSNPTPEVLAIVARIVKYHRSR